VKNDSRLYCEGWPQTGERHLHAAELADLSERVRGEFRRRRPVKQRLRAIGGVLAVTTLGFVVWNPGERPLALTLAAAFGVLLIAGGLLGALEAAIWSPRAWVRWMFRIGLSCAVLMVLVFESLPEGFAIALTLAVSTLGVFGGVASLVERVSSVRRWRPAFAVVELDLAEGRVMCFGGPVPNAEDPDDPASPTELKIEILPRSRFVHRVNAEISPNWETARVHAVSVARVEPSDIVFSDRAAKLQRVDESHTYRERALTPAEAAELKEIRTRLGRRAVADAVGAALFAAILVRLVESILHWRQSPELSRAGWIAVGIIVVLRVWRAAATWRALGADLRTAGVLLAWPRGASHEDPPSAEILPHSELVWTQHGEAPEWRRIP
jgi:hypothetical protein